MSRFPGISRILPLRGRQLPPDLSQPWTDSDGHFLVSDQSPNKSPEGAIGLTWADTVDLSRLNP